MAAQGTDTEGVTATMTKKAALIAAMILGVTATGSAIEAGRRAPEINLRTADGQSVRMSDLRGKVVIVDFWASWCEPCREELPVLEQLHQRYGQRGLVVVGVGIDREAGQYRSFLQRMDLSFPVVHDSGHQVAERYAPPTMPSSFIIDRNGVIRHVHEGFRRSDARELEQKVRELL